jgi:hypothetical protein
MCKRFANINTGYSSKFTGTKNSTVFTPYYSTRAPYVLYHALAPRPTRPTDSLPGSVYRPREPYHPQGTSFHFPYIYPSSPYLSCTIASFRVLRVIAKSPTPMEAEQASACSTKTSARLRLIPQRCQAIFPHTDYTSLSTTHRASVRSRATRFLLLDSLLFVRRACCGVGLDKVGL